MKVVRFFLILIITLIIVSNTAFADIEGYWSFDGHTINSGGSGSTAVLVNGASYTNNGWSD